MNGVAWAFVTAVAYGVTQIINRKANRLVDAYRTAFGLLVGVEVVLVTRAIVLGRMGLLAEIPFRAALTFALTTLFHFSVGWTLLAWSQQQIGVARTGALVSAAPLVGSILAAVFLDEALTPEMAAGVVVAVLGVALVSLSGSRELGIPWRRSWAAFAVATIWGTTPLLIRIGLRDFDHPVEGLTVGMAISLSVHLIVLAATRILRRGPIPPVAMRWLVAGGLTGAVGISAQWLSFALAKVAVAITIQQLAALVVIGLAPLTFREPFERMNARLVIGTLAMLAGTALVTLNG